MNEVLLKMYNDIAIYAVTEEIEVKIYSVECNDSVNTFTDMFDAVEYFKHLQELSKTQLFNNSKQKLEKVGGITRAKKLMEEDDIVIIDAESED